MTTSMGTKSRSSVLAYAFETPIGPIRLDVAKGDEGTRTHFSFGGQF